MKQLTYKICDHVGYTESRVYREDKYIVAEIYCSKCGAIINVMKVPAKKDKEDNDRQIPQ